MSSTAVADTSYDPSTISTIVVGEALAALVQRKQPAVHARLVAGWRVFEAAFEAMARAVDAVSSDDSCADDERVVDRTAREPEPCAWACGDAQPDGRGHTLEVVDPQPDHRGHTLEAVGPQPDGRGHTVEVVDAQPDDDRIGAASEPREVEQDIARLAQLGLADATVRDRMPRHTRPDTLRNRSGRRGRETPRPDRDQRVHHRRPAIGGADAPRSSHAGDHTGSRHDAREDRAGVLRWPSPQAAPRDARSIGRSLASPARELLFAIVLVSNLVHDAPDSEDLELLRRMMRTTRSALRLVAKLVGPSDLAIAERLLADPPPQPAHARGRPEAKGHA